MGGSVASDLTSYLEARRKEGAFPSYQALVIESGETLCESVGGFAVLEPEEISASHDTLYDLASLTKPLVTAILVLRLAEEGILPLDLPIGRIFEEMAMAPRDRVTVLDLLCHRGGFPAWKALYLNAPPALGRYARIAMKLDVDYEPGTKVVYSDLGFFVLGAVIEAVSGRPFPDLAKKLVEELAPSGDLLFCPSAEQRPGVAATERGNQFERRLAGAPDDDPRFGREMLWGQVHDGHARALGGIAPHAGLFGTARGVARVAAGFMDDSIGLSAASRSLVFMNLTPDLPVHRTVAFELPTGEPCGATGVLPDQAVGHSGFTGTSLWLDREKQRTYVLLTNRVHPTVEALNMNQIRRRFHELAGSL